MARSSTLLLLLFLLSASLCSSSQARKLHVGSNKNTKNVSPSFPMDSLFLTALPKGTVPSSTPSRKGHAAVVDEKLIARHLITVDRLLGSIPSPGAGH